MSVKPELFYVNISWSPPELPNGVITAYDICYLVNDSSTNRTVPPKPTYVSVDLSPPDTISGVVVIAHTRVGPGLASLLNAVSSLQVPRKLDWMYWWYNYCIYTQCLQQW